MYQESFYKIRPGSNVVRILTHPYQYNSHSSEYDQDKLCTLSTGECRLCKFSTFTPKRYWLLGVMSKLYNDYHILQMDYKIFRQFRDLAVSLYWGDPLSYDVDIYHHCYSDVSNEDERFQVIPIGPKYQLTSKLIEAEIDSLTKELEYLTTPPATKTFEIDPLPGMSTLIDSLKGK